MSAGVPALDWATDGRDWPHREHSRFVERGLVRWHVQIAGSGPPLVLVHGTGASTHSFRGLLPLLARRFTVISPDLPNHAFTSTSPRFWPSLPSMAAALADLLRHLGVEPAVGVGHSAGAAVLARMALDGAPHGALGRGLLVGLGAALVPFRGAPGALFGPAARLLAGSPLAAEVLALGARDRAGIARLIGQTGSRLDAPGLELYRRLASNPAHVAGVLAMLARWDLDLLHAQLRRLPGRLLLLAGELDRAVPLRQPRDVARRVPDGRLVVLRGLGHLLHEEDPAQVARLILDEATALGLHDARPAPETSP